MSRGGSYGGGQSSLGYLFGSDEPPSNAAPPSRIINLPPYGIDTIEQEEKPRHDNPSDKNKHNKVTSNNYHRAEGQNSGNFITDRPSTKVKSVPGGDSSLGYLFGDK
ncbi:hypothetical protein JCGZ_20549 [Jatropha curcas]|uniref:Protein SPIRAL1-like 5 n=1 Tax=Jatropha curcas TaxID=180498 RepID=A0A067JRE9_JATCU|nr:protein SPIRAL1-like 5 [Jatropha curcas]KDP25393.1 hypothetical protein JCGZ_20549 [Jatropha curcas]